MSKQTDVSPIPPHFERFDKQTAAGTRGGQAAPTITMSKAGDLRDGHHEFHWTRVRSRSLGLAYPHAAKLQSEVERKQLEILRHALGLDHLGLNKQGGTEGYRNHYALYRTSDDYAFLMDMCSTYGRLPLMGWRAADTLAQGMVYFHVTIGGHDFVKARTGIDHNKQLN